MILIYIIYIHNSNYLFKFTSIYSHLYLYVFRFIFIFITIYIRFITILFSFIYIYIYYKYTQYTHILCKICIFFLIWLIAINRLIALMYIYIYIYIYIHTYIHTLIYIYIYIYIFRFHIFPAWPFKKYIHTCVHIYKLLYESAGKLQWILGVWGKRLCLFEHVYTVLYSLIEQYLDNGRMFSKLLFYWPPDLRVKSRPDVFVFTSKQVCS